MAETHRISRALIVRTLDNLERSLQAAERREREIADAIARRRAMEADALLRALHAGTEPVDANPASQADAEALAAARNDAYWSRRAHDELVRAMAALERTGALGE